MVMAFRADPSNESRRSYFRLLGCLVLCIHDVQATRYNGGSNARPRHSGTAREACMWDTELALHRPSLLPLLPFSHLFLSALHPAKHLRNKIIGH